MASQAISDVVGDLLRRGLLVEEKAPAAGRGRPRTLLRIDPDAHRVVGAFLFPDHRLGVDIANLRGDRLFSRTFTLEGGAGLQPLAHQIGTRIGEVLAESSYTQPSIYSVGLGVPGAVDSQRGVLHWLPGYPASPSPFADWVAERAGLPVLLDSAADVLTRAEHWFGEDRQVDDFALIFVGFGIGLGRYVDGLLRTGDLGISPEIGHVKVTVGAGPLCHCGARGCLATYASVSGVLGRITEHRGEARLELAQMRQALETFAAEARAGDPIASDAFAFAGTALGVTVANYVNLWDPAHLLVLIQDHVFAELMTKPFQAALVANTLPVLRGRAQVQVRSSVEVNFAKGASALVLEQLYRGSASDRVIGQVSAA
jgi:predicted NBD/HSP70 family sugar kinase